MGKVFIRAEKCKGCGLCIHVCPKGVLALAKDVLNAKGYHPATVIEPDKCIGCAMCYSMCPDAAIRVEK